MLTRTVTRWLSATRCTVTRQPTWLGWLLGVSERVDGVARIRSIGNGYAWTWTATNRDVPRWLGERLDREQAEARRRA